MTRVLPPMPKPPPVGKARSQPPTPGATDHPGVGSAPRPRVPVDPRTRAERLAAVEGLRPRGLSNWALDRVRPGVLELIANTPRAGRPNYGYRQDLGHAFHLAAWDLAQHGELDLRRAFSNTGIEAYLADHYGPHALPSTLGSTRSKLVKVRRHNWPDLDRAPARYPKHPSRRPYSDEEIADLRRRIESLPAAHADDWRVLLALTRGAGLRSGEALALRANALRRIRQGMVLDVVNRAGKARCVPLPQWAAEILDERARALPADCPMLRPPRTDRFRIHGLVELLHKRQPNEPRFNVSSARNAWLLRLLHSDVSFMRIAVIADLKPNSHTIDLITFATLSDPLTANMWKAVKQ